MHLVDDVHLVFACLGRETHLLYQAPDIVHGIIGGSIQLMDVEGNSFVKRGTGRAFIAGFPISRGMLTIDRFGQYPGASSFAHTPRTAKEECMRQLMVLYGVFQRGGNVLLSDNGIKCLRSVFSGRNNKFFHTVAPVLR